MALQDVCGFQDTALYPRWNTPASLFITPEDTTLQTAGGVGWMGSPLQLYMPVPEYLTQSPLQFGQIRPNTTPSQTPPPHPASLFLPRSLSPSVPLPFPLSHGTTTLAFLFQGGIVAAADTRSSCSGLVACPASQKILPVHSHLIGTTSGTSADCLLWKRILARELRLYQLRHHRRPSTGGAAKLLSHMLHPFKGTELCVAVTLCGWDLGAGGGETVEGVEGVKGRSEWRVRESRSEREDGSESEDRAAEGGSDLQRSQEEEALALEGCNDKVPSTRGQQMSTGPGFGPGLYYVCSDGTRLQGKLFSVGSGSPYAYSVLDGGLRWELGVAEAYSLAREAVYRATHRDAYSGNCVDLYHVTACGWRRREREELREEYYREKEKERERVEERRKEKEGETKGEVGGEGERT
ncbi:hypothetical protein AAFF_G00437470 [Aldrovandia affinis]|uniref:Uncharacterized protein n=1 Tax=Aldrovandia affinis TaxID=143900 RepID=A0AAD7S7L2_9TELE|nr:hypothetical protein AAFF_G00437470 [Aldrovandia affinis]